MALGACSSGPRVTILVEGGEGMRPLRMAYVQVVPIEVSPVPLPVSLETLEEAGAAGAHGFTDAQGEFSFEMGGVRPHDVSVSTPALERGAEGRTWRGRLDAGGRIEPINEDGTGFRVTVVNGPKPAVETKQ